MADKHPEDLQLEDALRRQRELLDFYRQAGKKAPDHFCKDLFKKLSDDLKDQVGRVASELARHQMERDLGHPLDHEH